MQFYHWNEHLYFVYIFLLLVNMLQSIQENKISIKHTLFHYLQNSEVARYFCIVHPSFNPP